MSAAKRQAPRNSSRNWPLAVWKCFDSVLHDNYPCVLITVIRPAALSIFVLESSSGLLSMTFRERPTRELLSQIHRAGKWWAKTKDCITIESARCLESRFVWRIFLINRHCSTLRSSINCFRNFFRLAAWWFIATANNQSFQRLREHF